MQTQATVTRLPPQAVEDTSFEFEWSDENTVIPEQAAIAVYTNPRGNIVIRQAGQYHPSEDVWVIVDPRHAAALADAIICESGRAREDIDWQAAERDFDAIEARHADQPKDRTGAQRQKAYRARRKGVTGVTRNGASAVAVDEQLSLVPA